MAAVPWSAWSRSAVSNIAESNGEDSTNPYREDGTRCTGHEKAFHEHQDIQLMLYYISNIVSRHALLQEGLFMSKKPILLILLVMAVAVMVAGCVSPAGNATPTATPTETTPTTTGVTPTETMTTETTSAVTPTETMTTAATGGLGY
jgi:hypothetical protein